MKKLFVLILALVMCMCLFAGCNMDVLDITFKFDRAIIHLPDGTVVSGEVESWTDYEDGDQLQIKINGVTYLVHSSDAVLIAE